MVFTLRHYPVVTCPKWSDVQGAWKVDGALRDIYVHATTRLDWQQALDLVRERGWAASYSEDGKLVEMPTDVGEIFRRRGAEVGVLWQITPSAGVRINSHLFDESEIEFDLDPKEIVGQVELDVVCEFVRSVGRALTKRVLVTEENSPDWVVMSYDPATNTFSETAPPA
jgi:hypothetical protein